MADDATQLEREYLPPEGQKVRLLTLSHLDGRTLAAVNIRNFEERISSDLGELSAGQQVLTKRAAVISAIVEDCECRWARGESIDMQTYLPAVNSIRRLVSDLYGLDLARRAKPVKERNTGLPALLDR